MLLSELSVDEDEPGIGPIVTWLMTLDGEKETPQGWAIAREWLTAALQPVH